MRAPKIRARNTVVAGHGVEDDDADEAEDEAAEGSPAGPDASAGATRMATAPKARAVPPHYAHKPIVRGTKHRR